MALLDNGTSNAQKYSAGALWHLASNANSRVTMVNAGAIPLLVRLLGAKSADTREHAAAVVSILVRSQGSNKKAVFRAGGIQPLIYLLTDQHLNSQKHAASALWGLADGKEGIYDKAIVEHNAVPLLIALMQSEELEVRGFAAACLMCCNDHEAKQALSNAGGVDALLSLANTQATWLREQVHKMLGFLDVAIPESDTFDSPTPVQPLTTRSPGKSTAAGGGDGSPPKPGSQTHRPSSSAARQILQTKKSEPAHAKMKFHFFSFQINKVTGFYEAA